MQIRKYGLNLKRMDSGSIELVRSWRNSARIRSHMLYQEEISAEQQSAWFERVNNERNCYFLIHHQGEAIGLIDGHAINWESGVCEAGMFIYDKKFWSTHVPVLASFCLLDVFFDLLDLKRIKAIVRKDNLDAQIYNAGLGFVISDEDRDEHSILMELGAEAYREKTRALRKQAIRLKGEPCEIVLKGEDFVGKRFLVERFLKAKGQKGLTIFPTD